MEQHALTTKEGRDWLKGVLRHGVVKVTFKKKDGSTRVMECTLMETVVVPHEKTTDRVKEDNPDVMAVWDLDKNAWRSFRLDSVTEVNVELAS